MAADNLADMDTDALRTRIEREAAEINVKLSGGSVEIDEEHSTIRVVKGASMITLDPAARRRADAQRPSAAASSARRPTRSI